MNENNYIVATIPDEPEVKPQYFSGQDEWLTILFIPNWRRATAMTEAQAVKLAQDLEAAFNLRRKKFEAVCLDDLVQGENKMTNTLTPSRVVEIYYDAEFTGLHQNTTPISMGFVAETGETFYAEFTDYEEAQVNSWIQENVLDKRILCHTNGGNGIDLHGFVGSRTFVKEKLESWLLQFDQVQIVSDVPHYDWVLFCQLWGNAFNIPDNVSKTPHDINQDIAGFLGISEAEAFDINREKFCGLVAGEGDKHNALWDAKVIKACRDKMRLPRKVEVSEIKITSYMDEQETNQLIAESRAKAVREEIAEDFVAEKIAPSNEFLVELGFKEAWLDKFSTEANLTYRQYKELKEMVINAMWRGAVATVIETKLVE